MLWLLFLFFSVRKIVRPVDADKIANLAQHPKCLGTAVLQICLSTILSDPLRLFVQNFCSRAALEAMSTCFSNKYSEGYPGEWQGVDELARFGFWCVKYVNYTKSKIIICFQIFTAYVGFGMMLLTWFVDSWWFQAAVGEPLVFAGHLYGVWWAVFMLLVHRVGFFPHCIYSGEKTTHAYYLW